jgi:hypothetical protein
MDATVAVSRGRVEIGAGQAPKAGADVWLVRYDPRVQQVAIQRGENNGKTLPHRDVVRELTRLGGWNGAPVAFTRCRRRSGPAHGGAGPGPERRPDPGGGAALGRRVGT